MSFPLSAMFTHHGIHYFGFILLHNVLPNGAQEQIVFGQSLHRTHQNVGEPESAGGNSRLKFTRVRSRWLRNNRR
jgi:hypothetical protein